MKDIDRIEVGDHVRIECHGGRTTIRARAEVLGTPCATGDSWKFRDVFTGEIIYISEGCTLTRLGKED